MHINFILRNERLKFDCYHIFSPGRTFCPFASGHCVGMKVHPNVVFQEIHFLKKNFYLPYPREESKKI